MKYIHSHWQNLNECRHCGEVCGPAWHGRAWRHIYPGFELVHGYKQPTGQPKVLHCEWNLFTRRIKQLAISLSFGGGDNSDEIMFHVAVPFVCNLFFGIEGWLKWDYRKGERETSLRLDFEYGDWGSLWWNLWNNPNEWSSDVPKWRHGSLDFADWLLGSQKYQCRDIESGEYFLRLPEREYKVTITEQVSTWTRPAFLGLRLPFKPFRRVQRSFEVDAHADPVPIPGKGENSWDCDDDAIYASSYQVSTPEEAGDKFVRSVLETRNRYGWEEPQKA